MSNESGTKKAKMMQVTFAQFVKGAQRIISNGYNGRVGVVAISFKDKVLVMPTSCPYVKNVDRLNRPFFANDNLA